MAKIYWCGSQQFSHLILFQEKKNVKICGSHAYGICLLNITANQAHFHPNWLCYLQAIPFFLFLSLIISAGVSCHSSEWNNNDKLWCIKRIITNGHFTTISSHFFTKMRLRQSFWGAEQVWILIGLKVMTQMKKHTKIAKNTIQIRFFLQNHKKKGNGNICLLCHNFWAN